MRKFLKSDKISHIAFIMDGNGRWATARLLPRSAGHRAGINVMVDIADACFKRDIHLVSFYAFSTENKFRPVDEVNGLKTLIKTKLPSLSKRLKKNNVRLNVIGDRSYFEPVVRTAIDESESLTADSDGGILNLALNYGGRQEILQAAGSEDFEGSLYTAGQPDPDILVRTGGEKRLSNFMLYQLAYTELFFMDTLWPDFTETQLDEVIREYYNRDRRFGK